MGIIAEIKHQTKIIRKSLTFRKQGLILLNDKSSIQNLPTECLERIFSYVYSGPSNDRSDIITVTNSLFACAQVSRLWSTLIIPLLWRRPFFIVHNDKQNAILVNTLILFLSENDKNTLIDKRLKLETKSVHDRRVLRFNYPQMIRIFDYDNFIKSVHRWVVRYPNTCTEFEISQLLTKLLGRVLFKENTINGLRTFNFFRTKVYDNFKFISLRELSPLGLFNYLNRLTQLEYRNPHNVYDHNLNDFLEFFKLLTINSNNLKNISLEVNKVYKVDYMEIDHSISKLLLAQKRLINLSINLCSSIICDSIAKHVNSLNYLHFRGISNVTLLLEIIASCKELQTLELEQSWNVDDDDFGFTDLPLSRNLQIQNLYFNCSDEKSELLLLSLLEMTNFNLVTLSTKLITPNVIQNVLSHCTNVTTLNVANVSPHVPFNTLLDVISSLHLCQLYLEISFSYFQEHLRVGAGMYNLAASLPQTLKKLYLKCHMAPEFMYILLNKTQARLESLWLYNVSDSYSEYLKIIYKYSLERNYCVKEVRFGWNSNQRRSRRLSSVNSAEEEFHKNMAKQLKGAVQSVTKTSKGKRKGSYCNEGPFTINEVKDCIFSYHENVFERRLCDYRSY